MQMCQVTLACHTGTIASSTPGTRMNTKRDPTLAQRQAAARQRLAERGGRQITVALPPDINARLDTEMQRTGESARAVILRLLQNNLPD